MEEEKRQLMTRKATTTTAVKAIFLISPRLVAVVLAPLLLFTLLIWYARQPLVAGIYTSRPGVIQAVTLGDGTKVTLHGSSRLTLTEGFQNAHREVHLQGEAFFQVEKNVYPFRVLVGETIVTVVGTQFNIRQRGEAVVVSLVEGRVIFSARKQAKVVQIQLSSGQETCYTPAYGFEETTTVTNPGWPLWQKGIFIFENQSLLQVCNDFENHFGIRIHIDPSLLGLNISGRMQSEKPDVIMTHLANMIQAQWQRRGRQYTLLPRSP